MSSNRKKLKFEDDDTLEAIIFGNIAKERYSDFLGNDETREGGAIVYAHRACASMRSCVGIVTKIAKYDVDYLKTFDAKNTKLFVKYIPETQENRLQYSYTTPIKKDFFTRYIYQADTFTTNDIPEDKTYNYIFLEGAIGDYDISLIKKCATLGSVAVDASAFMREVVQPTGILLPRELDTIKEIAKYCDVIKLTYDESYLLTKTKVIKNSCSIIKSWGAKEVLITKGNIVCLMDKNDNYLEERIAEKINMNLAYLDTTTFVTYVLQRLTSDPIFSLYVACAVGTLKLKRPGPVLFNAVDLNHYLKFFYYYKPFRNIEPVDEEK